MNAEIRRLQRRFNAAATEGDSELAIEIGLELVKAINGQPKPSKNDLFYAEVVENVIVVLKATTDLEQRGDLKGMAPEERQMLSFALVSEVVKLRKKRREN